MDFLPFLLGGLVAQVPHRLWDGARSAYVPGLALTCNQPGFSFLLASAGFSYKPEKWKKLYPKKIWNIGQEMAKKSCNAPNTLMAAENRSVTHERRPHLQHLSRNRAKEKKKEKHIKCFIFFFIFLLKLFFSWWHHHQFFLPFFLAFPNRSIMEHLEVQAGGANTSKDTALSD